MAAIDIPTPKLASKAGKPGREVPLDFPRAWVEFVLSKGQQTLSDAGVQAKAVDRPAP